MLRSWLRLLLERPAGALARWRIQRSEGHFAILAFHNVVSDSHIGVALDRSLHLPLSSFCGMLDALTALPMLRFVSIDELHQQAGVAGVSVAVTFDDAYRGALRYALPELARRRIPATVFVAPELLGSPTLWWDDVANHFFGKRAGLWEEAREAMLQRPISGLARRVPLELRASRAAECSHAADCSIASVEELREACELPLVTIGCHSWSHACLPSLSDDELRADLSRSKSWLDESGLPCVPIHAFPYGRWTERERALLTHMGYDHAVRVDGGVFGLAEASAFCLPRINVPAGMTWRGLLLRIAGLTR